jgi:hypothetical protein
MTDFGAPPGTFPPPPPPIPPPPSTPLPPFGDRTGPPWEQPGPAVQRFIDTAKGALLDPTTTFRNVRREGGLGPPLVYYLLGGLVSVLFQAVWSGLGMIPGGGYGHGVGAGALGALIFGACIVVIGVFVGSGIIHLMLMLLGGQRFPFETTFRALAYAHGSAAPIGAVPFCGTFIAAIWGLVVSIIGLSQMQEIPIGKAAAAVLIPGIVCCVLTVLAFGAAIFAALGFAAMGSH